MRAQAGLNMTDGNAQVKTRQSRRERRGRIAVDQHHVGFFVFQDGLQLEQNVARDVEKRLTRFHDGQIVIGRDSEDIKNLVKHFTMLARYADDGFELKRPRFELLDKRAHLDGLRPRAEDEHDFPSIHSHSFRGLTIPFASLTKSEFEDQNNYKRPPKTNSFVLRKSSFTQALFAQ